MNYQEFRAQIAGIAMYLNNGTVSRKDAARLINDLIAQAEKAEAERYNGPQDLTSEPDLDAETCMCGSPMDSHGIGDGHSPVSVADYYAETNQQPASEPDVSGVEFAVGFPVEPTSEPDVEIVDPEPKAKGAKGVIGKGSASLDIEQD